jgi:hypothetical protein
MAVAAAVLGWALAVPAAADPNCKCRLAGERFDLGTVMCIRGKLARCEMFLNNTSWKTIADTCPEARLLLTPVPEVALGEARIATASR